MSIVWSVARRHIALLDSKGLHPTDDRYLCNWRLVTWAHGQLNQSTVWVVNWPAGKAGTLTSGSAYW